MKNMSLIFLVFLFCISCSNSSTLSNNNATPCSKDSDCTAVFGDTCVSGSCVCGSAAGALACSVGEECVSSTCLKFRTMFTTVNTFTPGATFSTTTATTTIKSDKDADAACQYVADQAGFKGLYVAWIATSTASALDRIVPSRIEKKDTLDVYNTNKQKIAGPVRLPVQKGDLADPDTAVPAAVILSNDKSAPASYVLTGATNSTAIAGSSNCTNWTVSTGSSIVGTATNTTTANTWFNNGTTQACSTAAPLYCIQVNY